MHNWIAGVRGGLADKMNLNTEGCSNSAGLTSGGGLQQGYYDNTETVDGGYQSDGEYGI